MCGVVNAYWLYSTRQNLFSSIEWKWFLMRCAEKLILKFRMLTRWLSFIYMCAWLTIGKIPVNTVRGWVARLDAGFIVSIHKLLRIFVHKLAHIDELKDKYYFTTHTLFLWSLEQSFTEVMTRWLFWTFYSRKIEH